MVIAKNYLSESDTFAAFVLQGLDSAVILVDFDTRTDHNHGTKFRLRQNYLPTLYEKATVLFDIPVRAGKSGASNVTSLAAYSTLNVATVRFPLIGRW